MFEPGSGLKIPIPTTRYYVYFLYSKGEIVYIGKSINPTQRIGAHSSTKQFDEAECFEIGSEEEMESAEALLIMKHQPILNSSFESKKAGFTNLSLAMKLIKSEGINESRRNVIRKHKELTGRDPVTVFGLNYIETDVVDIIIEELKK